MDILVARVEHGKDLRMQSCSKECCVGQSEATVITYHIYQCLLGLYIVLDCDVHKLVLLL